MKNLNINSAFFIKNRKTLAGLLKPNSISIVNSNDVLPTNADGVMRFVQNNDLFYLTGILQEKTVLLIYPDCADNDMREVLFVSDYDPDLELWEGSKLKFDEAVSVSGIKTVLPLSKFTNVFHDLMFHADNIYLNMNEHDRARISIGTKDNRFIEYCKKTYPLHNYIRLAPLLYSLRVIKTETEIQLIKEACVLTAKGFERLLRFVKPGVMEYEAEAELVHEFKRHGYDTADYVPIIASGINSCALHYTKNNSVCKAGDILLIDAAAGCGPYNADMTRTIPVNGRFTERQKKVYNAVLRVFKGTIKQLKPGNAIKEINLYTREMIAKELLDLKLVSKEDVKNIENKSPNFKKFYPHDVSHYLGLDVHDVGSYRQKLKPGMVLTCEPGIYIKEESFGVRIENDVLITKKGNEDLMKGVPVETEEIEDKMNKK